MKAISVHTFGGPEVLKLQYLADPRRPESGEVLVRVKAAGVNPYDTYMRAGTYGAKNPILPYIPGSDAAGVVESAGAGVDLKPGDRVYTTGTITGAYAELTLCNRSQVHRLPPGVNFAQGASLYVPYATAYRALFQLAQAKPGETVLVHGASGGVGLAAIQFAVAAGMSVIGTAGSDEGLQAVTREGARAAVNHKSADYRKQILDLTHGSGVEVILEMLANVNLSHDLKMLANRGRIVVIGSRGNVEITPREIMLREASILGVYLWGVPDSEAAQIHAAIQAGLYAKTLRPVIAAEIPLASAPEAHRKVMEPGAHGKIVLIP
ncbi:MAG TPA: NADPH:quinone reductase [Steroidobacteraceae bacterium]|jgi:NADPH2:quinone reductase|nr:NADPH:quinone reductase [Steroidobacteraceae bacterium]